MLPIGSLFSAEELVCDESIPPGVRLRTNYESRHFKERSMNKKMVVSLTSLLILAATFVVAGDLDAGTGSRLGRAPGKTGNGTSKKGNGSVETATLAGH